MVACELLVPCGLTKDVLLFFFSLSFCFLCLFLPRTLLVFHLFIFLSYTAQHTDNTDFLTTLATVDTGSSFVGFI